MSGKDLKRLMMNRKQFPLEAQDLRGNYYFTEQVPPLHPDLAKDGINIFLANSVLENALINSYLDLEESKSETWLGVYKSSLYWLHEKSEVEEMPRAETIYGKETCGVFGRPLSEKDRPEYI